MVDSRLPDGSRINAIIPPLAIDGAMVVDPSFGAASGRRLLCQPHAAPEMMDFLAACVRAA